MSKGFLSIRDAKIQGLKVIVRIDANVPLSKDGSIRDDFRLRRILPTLKLLKERGARSLLVSHMGENGKASVSPIVDYLNRRDFSVSYAKTLEDAASALEGAEEGEFVFLENVRSFPGELENEPGFSASLASLADVFVNEAFAVSHREHASITGVPKILPGYAGLLFEAEVENLSKMFSPEHPFLFILGGAKFSTKLPLIKKFLDLADTVYVGGALSNDILKFRGVEIGVSATSDSLEAKDIANHPSIAIPEDVVVKTSQGEILERKIGDVQSGDLIVDVGSASLENLRLLIGRAKSILWNGPLGLYEDQSGAKGTEIVTSMIASSGAVSIVGGGDTLAAIQSTGLENSFTFVSTGGGAMLDFLANETLPGIEALKQN